MRSDEVEVVCFALGLHLQIDPAEIQEAQRLEEDLGLDPLDLVLVALRLEEIGDGEFPVADLAEIVTVRDLVNVVRVWTDGPPTVRTPVPQRWSALQVAS